MASHLFGEIAQDLRLATSVEVEAALRRQAELRLNWASSQLGEVLILMEVLDGLQVERVLSEQRIRRRLPGGSVRVFKHYGNYDIVKKIGEGGMGETFLAQESMMPRQVVMKMLRKEKACDKRIAGRFALEAKISGMMSHANVVTCHNTGFANGVRFLILEYVPGETLLSRIKSCGKLPESDALRITRNVASGLAHIHAKGVIHRDVKPANVLLGTDGSVKLSDFGSARSLNDQSEPAQTIVGTPDYMAPEQALAARDVDQRADLYGLGAMLYHAVTGRTPFAGTSALAAMQAHVEAEPEPVRTFTPGVSSNTVKIIERLMAKRPADRFPNAACLILELDEALLKLQSTVRSSRMPASRPVRRKPQMAAAGCLGTALWAGALLTVVWLLK